MSLSFETYSTPANHVLSMRRVSEREFKTLLLPIPKEGQELLVSQVPPRDGHGAAVLTYGSLLAVVENAQCAARQDTTELTALTILLTGSQKSECTLYSFLSDFFELRCFIG